MNELKEEKKRRKTKHKRSGRTHKFRLDEAIKKRKKVESGVRFRYSLIGFIVEKPFSCALQPREEWPGAAVAHDDHVDVCLFVRCPARPL